MIHPLHVHLPSFALNNQDEHTAVHVCVYFPTLKAELGIFFPDNGDPSLLKRGIGGVSWLSRGLCCDPANAWSGLSSHSPPPQTQTGWSCFDLQITGQQQIRQWHSASAGVWLKVGLLFLHCKHWQNALLSLAHTNYTSCVSFTCLSSFSFDIFSSGLQRFILLSLDVTLFSSSEVGWLCEQSLGRRIGMLV